MDSIDQFTLYLYALRRRAALPTIVCLILLVRLWWKGELYGVHQRVFLLWFAGALAVQLATRNIWVWLAGFLAQIALALVLILRGQWTDSV